MWCKRGVLLFIVVLSVLSVQGHKTPIIEYTKLGLWETSFTYMPRQPVVGEPISLAAGAEHPDEDIMGEATAKISVYYDHSISEWSAGEEYHRPNWLLAKSVWADHVEDVRGVKLGQETFTTDVLMDQPGNYLVTVDWYEDGQLKGQDTHHMDVEQRTMGPLYWVLTFMIVGAVLLGVRWGIL